LWYVNLPVGFKRLRKGNSLKGISYVPISLSPLNWRYWERIRKNWFSIASGAEKRSL